MSFEMIFKENLVLIGDFKNSNQSQFFAYWITAFNSAYILLIFSLHSSLVSQCFSIILLFAKLTFSAKVEPFKSRASAFLHLFDFGCDLITAIINLGLTFATTGNREFTNAEALGVGIPLWL